MDSFTETFKTEKPEILIVDDISENLQLLSSLLFGRNFNISIATNGKQALEIAQLKPFDLILLDISMPEMDGFEVCQILKKDEKNKDIPIIFLTARTDIESVTKGFQLGGQDYVTKPFNPQELLARVNTHIELKKNRDLLKSINKVLEDRVAKRTEQLQQANAQLESLNADLVSANGKLSKLDKAKNDFLLLVNHELRTPLHGISGFTRILQHSLKQTEYVEFIELITKSTERLIRLSESALLITSLRADHYKAKHVMVAMDSLVDSVLIHLEEKLDEKNITVVKTIQPETVLNTDMTLLKSCLQIIVENTIRYSPDDSSIEILVTTDDKFCTLEVVDSGKGFSREVLGTLFNFFATDDVEHESDGFGLGLATAKLIMDTLNGQIIASNTVDKGASMKLIFNK